MTVVVPPRAARTVVGLFLVLAVLVTSTGCGPNDPPLRESSSVASSADHLPPRYDVTFRWAPTDVVDLHEPTGTFVRAFVESFELAFAGRSPEWGYPGFREAAPADIDSLVAGRLVSPSYSTDLAGTYFFRPLRREDDGLFTTMVLCRSEIQSVRRNPEAPAREWQNTSYPRWTFPAVIVFERAPGAVPAADRGGGARGATRDVFGAWRVVDYIRQSVGGTRYIDDEAECDRIGRNAEIPQQPDSFGPRPWPVMKPSPGWRVHPSV
ncbi:Uncharacterised protein [Gordonia terrae]|nr:Uncharacterised protein [Gordonia terrae]